jgi:hypothetical protein
MSPIGLEAKNDDPEMIGLAPLLRPLNGTLCSWPLWISPRARSHSRIAAKAIWATENERAGETFSPSLTPTRRPRRKANPGSWDQLESSPRSLRRSLASLFSIRILPSGARRSRTGSNVESHRAFLFDSGGALWPQSSDGRQDPGTND